MQPFDLQTAVNSQSWTWLLDLPRRLNVAIEIVDAHGVPMLPAGAGDMAAAFRRLVTHEGSPLRSAISNATQLSPQAVQIDGIVSVCFALAPAGVLVLSRHASEESEPAENVRQDVEFVGSWLAGVVEANLASAPNAGTDESHMLGSLQRLLDEAVSRGSVRHVVSAFIETLAVWLDIDVRGYVADAHGRFFQFVWPVGADRSTMPPELDGAAVPVETTLVRLPLSESERLGFASTSRAIVVRRLPIHTGSSWLMVFAGAIDSHDMRPLTVYSDLLRESLNDLTAEAIDRAVAAIMSHLSRTDDPVETTAQLAVDEIVAAVGARQGALVVTAAGGKQELAVGNTELIRAPEHAASDHLVVQSAHNGHLVALAVSEGISRFTAHQRDILEAATALLHPWARAALQRSGQAERRIAHLPFQAWIEQLASATIEEGGHASVIVISIPDMALRPGFMQTQVGRIRNHLRPSDFAGNLTGSEIAVLLRDTPAEQAAFVSARLKKLLEWDDIANEAIQPCIGMISCSADRRLEGSIVRAARENAARSRVEYNP